MNQDENRMPGQVVDNSILRIHTGDSRNFGGK